MYRMTVVLSTAFALACLFAESSAALGPMNVALLVNKNDAESLAVANYYRTRRGIPDRNVIYLDYQGNRQHCNFADFEQAIYHPVLGYLSANRLDRQVFVWVTTPGLPYRVGQNSISGVIHFGTEQRPDQSGKLGPAGFTQTNVFFDRFAAIPPPRSGKPARRLHMLLDAGSVEETCRMIDRSVAADSSHPEGTVFLFDGVGPRANRKGSIPFAKRLLEALGIRAVHRPDAVARSTAPVLGVYTGTVRFPTQDNAFVPGAIGDHLTSLGGALANSGSQMLCQEFLTAGCSATYGTVTEPYNYPQKFPTANLHVYYAMGHTAVESYWMSVQWPQQGLFVGDPLTRPFGDPPRITIDNLPAEGQVAGEVMIEATAEATGDGPGIMHIELFVDERRLADIGQTSLPADIQLDLTIGKKTFAYTTKPKDRMQSAVVALVKKSLDAGYTAIGRGGSLLLFGNGRNAEPLPIRTQTSSPLLYMGTVTDHLLPGEPRPLSVDWGLQGTAKGGDQVQLEIREQEGPPITLDYIVPESMAAGTVAVRLADGLGGLVVTGYQVQAAMDKSRPTIGRLTVIAKAAKQAAQPQARLEVKNQPGSTLSASNGGKLLGLRDPTRMAYGLAWLRFGLGPRRFKLRCKLPTARLADGRHELRAVACRGWDAQPQADQRVSFIVRNWPARLRLEALAEKLSVAQGAKPLVRAILDEVDPATSVTYLLNGQQIGTSTAPPHEITVNPAEWGVGSHRLTATLRHQGKPLWSDNQVVFEIVP